MSIDLQSRPETEAHRENVVKSEAEIFARQTPLAFSDQDRLDHLPGLSEQYALDDLLTEHFGFVPKVFTGHLFNIINEAIYDTVSSIEEAVLESYYPNPRNETAGAQSPPRPDIPDHPSRDDIARSLNQLETLLCSSIDSQFDLLEIWLHRNVFTFPNLREQLLKNFRFDHFNLWDPILSDTCQPSASPPNWESFKSQEEELWSQLNHTKREFLQAKDDYLSLLAVSEMLDRRLAGLKCVSSQLDQVSSESPVIYARPSDKILSLSDQTQILIDNFQKLVELDKRELIRFDKPSILSTGTGASTSDPTAQRSHGDEELDLPVTGVDDHPARRNTMIRYQQLLNLLTKSKVDDFLSESGEKASLETEKDEGLIEVLSHLNSQGRASVAGTSLHPDQI